MNNVLLIYTPAELFEAMIARIALNINPNIYDNDLEDIISQLLGNDTIEESVENFSAGVEDAYREVMTNES